MSLRKSVQIILIISSIIPVIFLTISFHGLINRRILETQTTNLEKLAHANSKVIQYMIDQLCSEVSYLAEQEITKELLLGSNQYDNPSMVWAQEITPISNNLCSDCKVIRIYDNNYQLLAQSSENLVLEDSILDLSTLDNINQLTTVGLSGIRTIKIDDQSYTVFDVIHPIHNTSSLGNELLGYLVHTVSITYFQNFFQSLEFGESGYGFLLNQDNHILYHSNQQLLKQTISNTKIDNLRNGYLLGRTMSNGSYTATISGENVMYAYQILTDTNWILFVRQNVSELISATKVLVPLLILSCSILLISMIVVMHFLSRSITNPILALRDTIRTATEGNLSVQCNIKSKNELGELSKNFNKMLHIINNNYEELSAIHDELSLKEEQLRANYDHIEYLAYHDTMTNLPNKLAFLDYVNSTLSFSNRSQKHCIFFLDLDNFKNVNDTLGHEHGDELLVKTAQILSSLVVGKGMLARAGGDEFLLFLENIQSREEANSFASLILETFRQPIDINYELLYVSMSIGISMYPDNAMTSSELIKYADIAMYQSKENGRNHYTLFDSHMEKVLYRKAMITDALRSAIDHNYIYVQYQPKISTTTKEIVGFEALMRIQTERLGYIPPEEFIPIAEESGLIVELSSWLLREACSFANQLINLGVKPRPVSVNISSVQINRPGFPALLSEILEETNLPAKYLELELTESTLVASIMDATSLLSSLHDIGVRISLDDFGTGYSALNYLTKMPIDTLKIDKSFIQHITSNSKDANIAQFIISLAHSLQIHVVAEGVERLEQLEMLKQMECDYLQGFIYSPPLHGAELMDLIRNT